MNSTKNFKAFMDIISLRSISKAATENKMTQGNLSQQIDRWEKELGFKLLTNERPMNLTETGRKFLFFCIEVCRAEEDFLKSLLTKEEK